MGFIWFYTDTGEKKIMIKFRSFKILETFTKGNLSVDIRASMLQSGNDAYNNIVDAFDNFFDLVNSKGGWNVYGWGKRFF